MERVVDRKLLLLSNSTSYGRRYLEHAETTISDFLRGEVKRGLFIPFARVLPSFSDFATKVRASFERMGVGIDSVHEFSEQKHAVMNAEAFIVGGGNTFYLLHNLYETGLLDIIRSRVNEGVPYIGWSAGANVACPTIKTTNDMPIVEPRSLEALDLVPFQVNPHYTEETPAGHVAETRAERIIEFTEVNPGIPVVGLRDGSMLRIEDSRVELLGENGACVFLSGEPPTNYGAGEFSQFLPESVSAQQVVTS